MEETIGYEALFSPEEWDAIVTGDWSKVPDEDWGCPGEGGPRGVGERNEYFSEEEWESLQIGGWVCTEAEEQGRIERAPRSHRVSVAYPPGEYEGNEERYELECDVCDHIGAADTMAEAQAIARLHEAFVATLVENWSVDR